MQHVDTLINARWVIPVEPDGTVLREHTVAIRDGRILDVLPTPHADARYVSNETVSLPEHALIPGFINAHTHAAMSLFRGFADDKPLMIWLREHIWPAEQRWVSPEFVRAGSRLAIAEMLRAGITCFNDMYFFAEETAEVAREAGIRAVVGLLVFDVATAYAETAEAYLEKALHLHDRLRGDSLVSTAFAPHSVYAVSSSALERVIARSTALNARVHMHLHESAEEIEMSLEQWDARPLTRLSALGLPGPQLMAVHMTQLVPAEIEALARSGAHVIHCPESNLKLASGFCPVHQLIRAGVNVALGTDGAAANNDLDMLGELRMATLNGARALGMADRIGSVTPGKQADLAAIDLSAAATQPVYDPISQIVYSATRDRVSDVWVNGKHLLSGHALSFLDEAAIVHEARLWRNRIMTADEP